MDNNITLQTKQMIDNLKAICSNFGLGNTPGEYKIITEVFLYKFLNDKFLFEAKNVEASFKGKLFSEIENALSEMTEDEYELFLLGLKANVAKLKKEHLISYLFNRQNTEKFHKQFDQTLIDIANHNIDVFSVKAGGQAKIKLFSGISQYVIEEKRDDFCKAIISKIASHSFEKVFEQKYDFFAQIFEYLIKDYNKDFGKYAEYYTPHSIATIIAKIMVPEGTQNVTVYDPAAGTGTLVLALAHQIGENNCTIYTQDIAQKSTEFLRLNLILNNLVHSLPNVVHDDTLLYPYHKNSKGNGLAHFDFIVSNPPFNTDFSDSRDTLADEKHKKRFFAGVPNIPKKDRGSMPIYLMFLQHILYSLDDTGRAAIVVPSGFLTDTGSIQTIIREKIISEKSLRAVVQMPTNVFANTNTSVSILFIDKKAKNEEVMFVDASRMGESIKIDDTARIVLSKDDELKIVSAITNKKSIPEFSVNVTSKEIKENEMMIKPGLYFEMQYSKLREFKPEMEQELQKVSQRKAGLIRMIKNSYIQNQYIKWFVDFDFPTASQKTYDSEYGILPIELDLIPISQLIEPTIGGEWGKESPEGKYIYPIRCIRGTDIPNIVKSYYDDVPERYVQKKHIDEKQIQPGDIVIEISGGSPIQSTGRICLITEDILQDMDHPALCTNFCRIIRLKDKKYAEYVYNFLSLLYTRGYFFNLENNTTGIKNLIFRAFEKNIKVPIPNDETFKAFYDEINSYCKKIDI